MGWSVLPDDVVGVILTCLSLAELARISSTSKGFQAVFYPRMAEEDEAKRDLAIKAFGHQRITSILDLILQFLKGGPVDPKFLQNKWNWCWVSADGVFQGPAPNPMTVTSLCEAGDVRVSVLSGYTGPGPSDSISIRAPQWSPGVQVSVQMRRGHKGATIEVVPTSNEDLEAVAFVQTLLTEGLAGFIHDAGQHVEICVKRSVIRATSPREGLKEQIAPLMQFASGGYTPAKLKVGDEEFFEWRIQVGQT
jgi:hypothetical protein